MRALMRNVDTLGAEQSDVRKVGTAVALKGIIGGPEYGQAM
jgi:hypothetical protein